jgi:DNA-binding GntR family transcriptional regulator
VPIPTTPIDLIGTPARDEVYEVLLHRLLTGDLAPGSRLSDRDLLAMTRSSRAPLREALNRLAHLGLVQVVPRQYTEVAPLDARRAREALAVQGEVLAQAVVEAVPALGDDDRRALVEQVDDHGDDVLAVRRDLVETILAAAGNREYTRICDDVGPYVERALTLLPGLDTARLHGHLRDLARHAAQGGAEPAADAWRAAQELLVAAPFPGSGAGDGDGRPPAPAEAVTLRDKAAATIEQAIGDGTLVPGETLRESALMAWLGISRTPVREALLQLAGRGVVEVEHHRPARVATMDHATVRHALRAVIVLRQLGVREAMRDDATSLTTTMRRAHRDPADLRTADDIVALTTAVADALEVASHNAVWLGVHRGLTARVRWYAVHDPEVVDLLEPALVVDLVDALADGRTDDAMRVLRSLHELVPRTGR